MQIFIFLSYSLTYFSRGATLSLRKAEFCVAVFNSHVCFVSIYISVSTEVLKVSDPSVSVSGYIRSIFHKAKISTEKSFLCVCFYITSVS